MLVVGICGRSAEDISARLSRHVTGAEFAAVGSPMEGVEVPILSMVHAASRLSRAGEPEPRMALVAVDPPRPGTELYRPLAKFLAARPDNLIVPFWLHVEPPDVDKRAAVGSWSTYQQFATHISELTGENLTVGPNAVDDPVLTTQVASTIGRWSKQRPVYRTSATPAEREKLGDGTVVTYTAVKGGSGKSTLALISANLLTNWGADTSASVILIDANLGQPVIAGLTWEVPRKDARWAVTQLEEGMPADDVLVEVAHPIASGARSARNLGSGGKIHAIVSTLAGAGRTITYQPEAMCELVAAAARKYDYVIVDAPPIDPVVSELAERFVLPATDKVVLVCDSDFSSTRNALLYYDEITGHVPGLGEHIGFVLNKLGEHSEFNASTFNELLGMYGRDTEPPWNVGAVPYDAQLKKELNTGLQLVPEIPGVDNAIARILETLLGEPEGAILPKPVPGKNFLKGLFQR